MTNQKSYFWASTRHGVTARVSGSGEPTSERASKRRSERIEIFDRTGGGRRDRKLFFKSLFEAATLSSLRGNAAAGCCRRFARSLAGSFARSLRLFVGAFVRLSTFHLFARSCVGRSLARSVGRSVHSSVRPSVRPSIGSRINERARLPTC